MHYKHRVGLYIYPWHPYVREFLGGVREAATGRGWELYSPWAGMNPWPDPRELKLAGLIAGTGPKLRDNPVYEDIALVRIGTAMSEDPVVDVTWDDRQIGALAAEHLLNQGHRTLCAWHELDYLYQQQRVEGFCEAVRTAGLAVFKAKPEAETVEERTAWLMRLPEPCALFCVSDRIGHELLRIAERVGRRVPESLAVVGAGNDEDYCELAAPAMSSVALPGRQAGRHAVEVLAARLAGASPKQQVRVPPTYVAVRRSSDLLAIDDLEVLRALKLIRDQAMTGLTVSHVHAQANVSRRSLELRFRGTLGRTLGQEIIRVRHQEARRLLTHSRASIADVAEQCGFSTPQRFTAAFTQAEGCSPSEFRSRVSR